MAVMRPGSTAGTWTTRFVHSDGLGSVRVLTDETGTTIDQRGYEAFGTKNVEAGGDAAPYRFTGGRLEGYRQSACTRGRRSELRRGWCGGRDSSPSAAGRRNS